MERFFRVVSLRDVAENVFVLSFHSPRIAATVRAGQFLNIRVDDATDPLLRRPFSTYRTDGDLVEIIFNVVGRGTAALRRKRPGDLIDVLGPLGVPFSLETDDYAEAILIAGGLGVAPLPIATVALRRAGKKVLTFLGARSAGQVIETHLENVQVATDDGSKGFHGNVVDLAREYLGANPRSDARIFACGPTPMLRALASFALASGYRCEVALEGPMACGIGICQGCPVELAGAEKKYALMCKDGPAFDVRKIKF